MKIDRKLNLTFEVGGNQIHSTPISNTVFEQYYLALSKTFARFHREGLQSTAGPRVAKLLLRDVCTDDGTWLDSPDGKVGIENGLLAEIIRLTNVSFPTTDGTGWKTLPLYSVKQQEIMSAEEISEVENTVVFFTLISAMHKKEDIPGVLRAMEYFWGVQLTSLNATEFTNSLPTKTPDAPTGVTLTTASVPS
jgi:hypothetical protein